MEEKKSAHAALTIDRAAFLLLRVKKAFKKKKLQRKEKERNAQLNDQRASCAGIEGHVGRGVKSSQGKPPLLRSRTLPAIVVPGVNILQAQIDARYVPDGSGIPGHIFGSRVGPVSRHHSARLSFSRDDTATLDVRRKSAISRLCSTGSASSTSASYGPERNPDGTVVLRVPAPHVVAARAYRMSSPSPGSGTGSTALYRLARLLNQGSKQPPHAVDDTNVTRRLSWERRDTTCSHMTRSSSIDSMVEAVWSESGSPTKRGSLLAPPRFAEQHRPSLALVSPSVGRRMKGQRGINELPSFNNEMELASIPPPAALVGPQGTNKPSKKQAKLMQQRLDRLARVNIHLHALFAAIEHGHLEKARTILESTDVDVNSLNSDSLSALDVAILSNNRPLAKMLISFGAQEGNQFTSPEILGSHLKQLLGEAELRLQELGGGNALLEEPSEASLNTRASFSSIIGSAYPTSTMTGCAGGDTDKQLLAWGRRAKVLRRMVLGFAQARPPDPPSVVAVDITASATVVVRLQEPASQESPITTRYKIQWSTRADFSSVCGERELLDISRPQCIIDLTHGRRYFFRAACGNVKGYGAYMPATPTSVVPSSWKEVDQREPRFEGRLKQLDQLVEEVKQARPGCELLEIPVSQRRTQRKKTTIKQLFSAASKFQKNLRRGIYLACILYHDDKVLVTNEDFIPVIEIDETFPSCIHTDHHWLMKIACTWDDTKSLRADMEKNASSTVHFRTKLLSAALQMQSALCLQDLGQLYHKPLRDSQGTMVLSTINYVKTPKSVSVLNSRWLPLNKVHKKMVLSEDNNVGEILMASIQEQINYHQVSGLKLSKGLYLGYLKMQSSVDLIQVVVPAKSPNVLPHCKVRENPHVSAEEWEYLKQQHKPDVCDQSTEQQRSFLELITSASRRLFKYMDITNEDALTHRLYDYEVIDINDDVSFIIICPPAEFSCAVPGQREILLQRGDLLSLPIQVFEMIHLNTYQNNIIKRYSRLSCILELDAATANHMHREAFSSSELAIAKERLTKLQDLQTKLNSAWKSVRWLMDVITFARDRSNNSVLMKHILEKQCTENSNPNLKRSLLQIPPRDSKIVKSTPGRGSWPGPGATNTINPNSCLMNEFSKSEQHLSTNDTINSSQYLNVSDTVSRKNSDGSYSGYFSDRLPPSRSEDMLYNNPLTSNSTTVTRPVATTSSVSASTSPLLNVRPMYGGSLLSVNTMNTTNTSDSMHSLSSDSDNSCPAPLSTSTPHKKHKSKSIVPSRSMSNMKQNLDCSAKFERKYSQQNHLKVDTNIRHSNLETTSSKSLSNIKKVSDVEMQPLLAPTYLKPLETNKPDLVPDPTFKVPFTDTLVDTPATSSNAKEPLAPGILQVYAAYETGLASGTSLKLHVTPRTTAREVVDLVVKQLNMAVVLKGKDGPIYTADKLKNFCLVAVIGARERCLRDDFKPLQLQNPWKKGRLYVRQKHDVLAALEHSSKHGTFI